jgi:FkbM family methyltransferase
VKQADFRIALQIAFHNSVRVLWYVLRYTKLRMLVNSIFNKKDITNVNAFGYSLLPLSLYKTINTGSQLFPSDKKNPNYELLVDKAINQLRNGDVFIDIGAYLGWYSKLGSSRVGTQGKVISVEPNPETFKSLQSNFSKLDNTTCFQAAIGDYEGLAKFFLYDYARVSSLIVDGGSVAKQQCKGIVNVQITTVDSLIKKFHLSHVSMIKIDTEGTEFAILKGARKTLTEKKPKLVIEIHRDSYHVWVYLKKLGYEVMPLSFSHIFAYPQASFFSDSLEKAR